MYDLRSSLDTSLLESSCLTTFRYTLMESAQSRATRLLPSGPPSGVAGAAKKSCNAGVAAWRPEKAALDCGLVRIPSPELSAVRPEFSRSETAVLGRRRSVEDGPTPRLSEAAGMRSIFASRCETFRCGQICWKLKLFRYRICEAKKCETQRTQEYILSWSRGF